MTQTNIDELPIDASCCSGLQASISPKLFKALCSPTRITLLTTLAACGRPCTVSELAKCCPVDVSVVSRHLAILREAGVLSAERRGKEVYYSVRVQSLSATLRAIADALDACCPPGSTGCSPA